MLATPRYIRQSQFHGVKSTLRQTPMKSTGLPTFAYLAGRERRRNVGTMDAESALLIIVSGLCLIGLGVGVLVFLGLRKWGGE